MSQYECRRFSRSPITLPVALRGADGAEISGNLHDVSMVGLRVLCNDEWPVGTSCHATFCPELLKDVELEGRVVRASTKGLCLEITRIESASFGHLRELVVAHAEDPHTVDTEIVANRDSVPPLY